MSLISLFPLPLSILISCYQTADDQEEREEDDLSPTEIPIPPLSLHSPIQGIIYAPSKRHFHDRAEDTVPTFQPGVPGVPKTHLLRVPTSSSINSSSSSSSTLSPVPSRPPRGRPQNGTRSISRPPPCCDHCHLRNRRALQIAQLKNQQAVRRHIASVQNGQVSRPRAGRNHNQHPSNGLCQVRGARAPAEILPLCPCCQAIAVDHRTVRVSLPSCTNFKWNGLLPVTCGKVIKYS